MIKNCFQNKNCYFKATFRNQIISMWFGRTNATIKPDRHFKKKFAFNRNVSKQITKIRNIFFMLQLIPVYS